MRGIVVTESEKNQIEGIIDAYFNESVYGSFDNFKIAENRNIVFVPIKNDNYVLSPTVLNDDIYKDLFHVVSELVTLNEREIEHDELLDEEI